MGSQRVGHDLVTERQKANEQCCGVSIAILCKFRIICQVKKICLEFCVELGFPYSSVGKASACNVGDLGSIPGSGSSPGEGNGNPL